MKYILKCNEFMYEISNIQKYVYLLKNLFFAKCHTRQI